MHCAAKSLLDVKLLMHTVSGDDVHARAGVEVIDRKTGRGGRAVSSRSISSLMLLLIKEENVLDLGSNGCAVGITSIIQHRTMVASQPRVARH